MSNRCVVPAQVPRWGWTRMQGTTQCGMRTPATHWHLSGRRTHAGDIPKQGGTTRVLAVPDSLATRRLLRLSKQQPVLATGSLHFDLNQLQGLVRACSLHAALTCGGAQSGYISTAPQGYDADIRIRALLCRAAQCRIYAVSAQSNIRTTLLSYCLPHFYTLPPFHPATPLLFSSNPPPADASPTAAYVKSSTLHRAGTKGSGYSFGKSKVPKPKEIATETYGKTIHGSPLT